MNEQKTRAYLQRIHIDNIPVADLENLRQLQAQHLYNVPFENLDIHRNIPIVLDEAALFTKIVTRRRGGYCYELNGLFYCLLDALGYDVHRVSAQVHQEADTFGEPFDHLALLVQIDGHNWLVDVGFGSFARYPLQLDTDTVQEDPHGSYQITPRDGLYLICDKDNPVYLLDPTPRKLADFSAMNQHRQTSPESFFTRQRMISRPTEHGRITLTDKVLRIRENGDVQETEIGSSVDFEQMLTRYFPLS